MCNSNQGAEILLPLHDLLHLMALGLRSITMFFSSFRTKINANAMIDKLSNVYFLLQYWNDFISGNKLSLEMTLPYLPLNTVLL